MSILEKYSAAIKNKDEAVMNDLLHDDFKFTMHKSGNVLGKSGRSWCSSFICYF